jgi:hypothetical protein
MSQAEKLINQEEAPQAEPAAATGNLDIYNRVRTVPAEAQEEISGGRLSGMTTINPMWRIRALTENFGVCGFGWKYEITKQWTEISTPETIAAFVNLNLYVKYNGEWSEPIFGTGGSSFLAKEKNGLYTDDNCYKKALTDALSVACKSLGIGADVYWEKGVTVVPPEYKCTDCGAPFNAFSHNGKSYTAEDAYHIAMRDRSRAVCKSCFKKPDENKKS